MAAARDNVFDCAVNTAKALPQGKIHFAGGSSAELMKCLSLICAKCTFAVAGEFLILRRKALSLF